MKLRVSRAAEADLKQIVRHISADDPLAAKRWLESIRRRFERLAEFPGIGVQRDETREGLRMLPAGAYLILYAVGDRTLDIVRVVHGARQWERLFKAPDA